MMTNVLIIEDETNIRLFFTANLEARGFTVLEASTGTAGLQLLRTRLPDVTLLDMLLPDMQGWDILQAMAEDNTLNNIPVILMSASVNTRAPANAQYTNLVARLSKPCTVQVLIQALQDALA